MSDGYKELAASREHWDAKREAEIGLLRNVIAEARRLIIARGESTDRPLQVQQHRFLATCNQLGIQSGTWEGAP